MAVVALVLGSDRWLSSGRSGSKRVCVYMFCKSYCCFCPRPGYGFICPFMVVRGISFSSRWSWSFVKQQLTRNNILYGFYEFASVICIFGTVAVSKDYIYNCGVARMSCNSNR